MKNFISFLFILVLGTGIRTSYANIYIPGDTTGLMSSIKVPVKSGLASKTAINPNEVDGYAISKSFDGNLGTYYDSGAYSTLPILLEFFFEDVEYIDYIKYYSRDNATGAFGNFEILAKYDGSDEYVSLGNYNLGGTKRPNGVEISLPYRLNNPTAIKFSVSQNGAKTGQVICSEMEFYANTSYMPEGIFADDICSTLLPGVTIEQINAIPNDFYKKLALALYGNYYPMAYHVQTYEPYSNPDKLAEINKTEKYSMLDNPTGIYADAGETIVVIVGNTNGQQVHLRQVNFYREACTEFGGDGFDTYQEYPLKEGTNIIKTTQRGLFYFIHNQEDLSKAKPIAVNFTSGKVNAYFDKRKHTNADWPDLLNNAQEKLIDVLGERAHLVFPVESFKANNPQQIEQLIAVYDSIVAWEEDMAGFNKYGRQIKNRMMFTVMYATNDYMYNAPYYTAYSTNSVWGVMGFMCSPSRLVTMENIWGPAHEVGHTHQIRPGFRWLRMGEVTNNIFAAYVNSKLGNASRLYTEAVSNGRGNHYENALNSILVPDTNFMESPGEFNRLVPLWQLYLYATYIKGNNDFYKDLNERLRIEADLNALNQSGEIQTNFTQYCCAALEEDLSDFFEAWKFYQVIENRYVPDGFFPTSTPRVTISQAMINDAKAHNSNGGTWKKPEYKIEYLNEGNIDTYVNKKTVLAGGNHSKALSTFNFSNWGSPVAYELYDKNNKLLYVSQRQSFSLANEGISVTDVSKVRIVQYDGQYEEINYNPNSIDNVNTDSVHLFVQDGIIRTSGGETIESVHSLSGSRLDAGKALQRGVYIVKVDNRYYKVMAP